MDIRTPTLSRADCGHFSRAHNLEWVVLNGDGGYAAGTVGGARTRRSHGLLAALPDGGIDPVLMVATLGLTATIKGVAYDLHTDEFAGGVVNPRGYVHLAGFRLENAGPVWIYDLGSVRLEKRVRMVAKSSTTLVSLTLLRAQAPVHFKVRPFCTYRAACNPAALIFNPAIKRLRDGVEVTVFPGAMPCRLSCREARFTADPDIYFRFHLREEARQGLSAEEDLYTPGFFKLALQPEQTAVFCLSMDTEPVPDIATIHHTAAQEAREVRSGLPSAAPDWIRLLALSAAQILPKTARKGVWQSRRSRDIMMALPGLARATGRYDGALQIVRRFVVGLNKGLPVEPSVDAMLWSVLALRDICEEALGESAAGALFSRLSAAIDIFLAGTHWGTRSDPVDGLLYAGDGRRPLTWMNARTSAYSVTPRTGKAVEVNALWVNALSIMAGWADRFGSPAQAQKYEAAAARAESGFAKFWCAARGYLYDVIDGPGGTPGPDGYTVDARLRPNQLLAVSLPVPLLSPTQAKSVVEVCTRTLLTSVGLRTLAPDDRAFVPVYGGGESQRASALHQGTVWPWLMGPFVEAHFRVYGDKAEALSFLEGFEPHVLEGGIGFISQLFDGGPPHDPKGAPADLLATAEILRIWCTLQK